MIFTQYIKELQRLDEMELEVYQTSPNPPIMFSNEQTEFLKNIKELQYHIVKTMAVCLGVLEGGKDIRVGENIKFREVDPEWDALVEGMVYALTEGDQHVRIAIKSKLEAFKGKKCT